MDYELSDRLRRLREAHAVLAVELSTARRALREARSEVAGLRAELAREQQRHVRVNLRSAKWGGAVRIPSART